MTPVTNQAVRTPIDGWEHAWNQHGAAVLASAAAVGLSDDAALQLIVPAMADPAASFDPLEAMLGPLVHGRRRFQRRRIEAVRTRPRVGPPDVSFAVLQQLAAHLPSVVVPDHPVVVEEPSTREQRGRRGAIVLIAALIIVLTATATVRTLRNEQPVRATLFGPLTPDAFDGWQVVRSEANVALPTNHYDTLVQDFENEAGTRGLRLETTPRYVRAFADEALGDIGDPSIASSLPLSSTVRHLARRDIAISDFYADPSGTQVHRGSWVTTDAAVRFTATGFSEVALLAVLDDLVQRDPSGRQGVDLGPSSSGLSVRRESRHATPSTSLQTQRIVLNNGRGGTVDVSIQMPKRPQLVAWAIGLPGAARSQRSDQTQIRPGLIAERFLSGGRFAHYHWADRGASVEVSSSSEATAEWHTQVETLLRGFGSVDEATWQAFDRAAKRRVASSEVLDRVIVGPLDLTFRAPLSEDPLSWGVCASGTCAVWQTSGDSKDPYTADLLIDGHWWHLERFGALAERTTDHWLTSPADQPSNVFQLDDRLHTTWRATDFGTRTQAARTRHQQGVLTRPTA